MDYLQVFVILTLIELDIVDVTQPKGEAIHQIYTHLVRLQSKSMYLNSIKINVDLTLCIMLLIY